jgi:hypothetical protein
MAHLTTNTALPAARRLSPLRFLAAIGDARSSFRRQFQPDRGGDIRIMKLKHIEPVDEDAAWRETLPLGKFESAVIERHDKVTAIISRHLKEIHAEVLQLDPATLNIDNAGDEAEIARQVLTVLADRLRGFSVGSRTQLAQEERERRELFGEDEDEEAA